MYFHKWDSDLWTHCFHFDFHMHVYNFLNKLWHCVVQYKVQCSNVVESTHRCHSGGFNPPHSGGFYIRDKTTHHIWWIQPTTVLYSAPMHQPNTMIYSIQYSITVQTLHIQSSCNDYLLHADDIRMTETVGSIILKLRRY